MPDTQTDWHAAGCARDCSVQHTYQPGRCALSTEQPPEPTISIGRVETMADGQPGIVLRSIPASVWDGLIAVAAHVSTGRGFAFVGQGPYPDAKARRILGALHDAGLLPQPEEPAVRPEAATQATDDEGPLVQIGWYCWRCHGINPDPCRSDAVPIHVPAEWADDMRTEIEEDHDEPAPQPTEPATVTDPEWLRQQYAAVIQRCVEEGNVRYEHLADAVMRVRDRHLAQLRQRLRLADELLATRDAELAAAKKTARGIGAWGVLQAIEQALPPGRDDGPTIAEAAVNDRLWPLEKHGE